MYLKLKNKIFYYKIFVPYKAIVKMSMISVVNWVIISLFFRFCLSFFLKFFVILIQAEDAVCLADYCDIMRCEVLLSHDSTLSFGDAAIISTDIEVWNEATAYRTAMTPSGPRDLARVPLRTNFFPPLSVFVPGNREASGSDAGHKSRRKQCKGQTEDANEGGGEQSSDNLNAADDDDESDDGNNTSACDKNLVDSALPAIDKKQQKLSELQRLKANCKTEDLDLLKKKCEVLIRDCIEGLLVNLSHQDFKEMEGNCRHLVLHQKH